MVRREEHGNISNQYFVLPPAPNCGQRWAVIISDLFSCSVFVFRIQKFHPGIIKLSRIVFNYSINKQDQSRPEADQTFKKSNAKTKLRPIPINKNLQTSEKQYMLYKDIAQACQSFIFALLMIPWATRTKSKLKTEITRYTSDIRNSES